MLGQYCADNVAFISSLLEGLFLNNGDASGFENIAREEEVLIGGSDDSVKYQGGKNTSSGHQVTSMFWVCLSTLCN